MPEREQLQRLASELVVEGTLTKEQGEFAVEEFERLFGLEV